MSDWNEERAVHKAERRSPAPDARLPNKKKKAESKPFEVWRRRAGAFPDMKVTAFTTREQAERYIEKLSRGAYVSTLHVPAGTPIDNEILLSQQEKLRSKHFIKERA